MKKIEAIIVPGKLDAVRAELELVSGDRESEVRYLADQVGITEICGEKSPEEKIEHCPRRGG